MTLAQTGTPPRGDDRGSQARKDSKRAEADALTRQEFQRLDRDGRLTRGEVAASPLFHSDFDQLDKDGNGVLTREEFTADRRLPAARRD